MSKYKIVLDYDGVGNLLKSDDMEKWLQDFADEKVNSINHDDIKYVAKTSVGTKRARVEIFTANWQAYDDNKENNTLLKVLR